ncbi:sterol desaturase family protein [Sphingomonas sp.]|uniref:sterol desaturase family protein n=1 Tax=Sphingomonas sp. TaxID=28214 RepID=UPI001D886845|nr:sterol desaturase family protein [Sphingomonas sp.]MBX9795963.1 sterol desaturase family protein [Sphingomonas sp.]
MDSGIVDWWNAVAAEVSGERAFFWALGSYVTMILVERLTYLLHDRTDWNERDARANVINSSVTAIIDAFVGGPLFVGAYFLVYDHLRLFDMPYSWWGWVAAFLLNDLAYYVDHRISHRTGLFWAIHTSHHSSREMNLTVASRGTALGLGGIMQPAYFLFLPLMGVAFPMFIAAKFFGNLWGIFNHTRLVRHMGVLEEILATPANHRVHHGTEPKYLDRNYGQVLIVWDRLFGSFQREEEEPTYGLVKQLESDRIWDIQTSGLQWLVGEMRRAPRLIDKLRYLWMPPGWRHDGCHLTTEQIRRGVPGCIAGQAAS